MKSNFQARAQLDLVETSANSFNSTYPSSSSRSPSYIIFISSLSKCLFYHWITVTASPFRSANISKFNSSSACHLYTSGWLFYPKRALWTLLKLFTLCQVVELPVFLLSVGRHVLFTRHTIMVLASTSKAVVNVTYLTKQLITLRLENKGTVWRWTARYIGIFLNIGIKCKFIKFL